MFLLSYDYGITVGLPIKILIVPMHYLNCEHYRSIEEALRTQFSCSKSVTLPNHDVLNRTPEYVTRTHNKCSCSRMHYVHSTQNIGVHS